MTSAIPEQSVKIVSGFLKGKRLEKLMTSVEILRSAEVYGSFQGRESVKALAGFGPGLLTRKKTGECLQGEFPKIGEWTRTRHVAESCLRYGSAYPFWSEAPFSVEGVAQEVIEAWVQLCCSAHQLYNTLKEARPKPVVTAIGLSPKVTVTLTGMNLDLDLPTITPAEIEAYKVQSRNPKTGERLFEEDGTTPVMETAYRVKWSKGIKLGKSRYRSGCQACGKSIPSGRYVPIEADCRQNGRIGLWVGCDCARNIFGVKDLGIAKEE